MWLNVFVMAVEGNQTINEMMENLQGSLVTSSSLAVIIPFIGLLVLGIHWVVTGFFDGRKSEFSEFESESEPVVEFEVLHTKELDVSCVKCDYCGSPQLQSYKGELYKCAHCGHLYKIKHEMKKGRMVH